MELVAVYNPDAVFYILASLGIGYILYLLLKWRNNKNDN